MEWDGRVRALSRGSSGAARPRFVCLILVSQRREEIPALMALTDRTHPLYLFGFVVFHALLWPVH